MKTIMEEYEKLDNLVNVLAERMKLKLKEKAGKGWGGWDNAQEFPAATIIERIKEHLQKEMTPKNAVDIVNLAAFLWNRVTTDWIDQAAKRMFGNEETP